MDDDRYDKGKVSIGLVFRYENECFISMGKHFFNEIEENKEDRLSDLIRYAYINEMIKELMDILEHDIVFRQMIL